MFEGSRTSRLRLKIERALLAFDAFVDSSLNTSLERARANYAAFTAYMDGFHIAGWRRVLNELACETLTIGLGIGIVALTLGGLAFQETSDDWLKKTDLAVTFLDRYGQEVGRRGIMHDDRVSFDDLPPNLIHAVVATEDRRFFEHFGIDVIGTLRALTVNARADSVVQGGSSITQQLAKNLFLSNKRTLVRKIKEAYLAHLARTSSAKKRDIASFTSIAPTWGRRVRRAGGGAVSISANPCATSSSPRPPCLLACSRRQRNMRRMSICQLPARGPTDVLNNMVEAGFLTEGKVYAALRNPATPVDRSQDLSPGLVSRLSPITR